MYFKNSLLALLSFFCCIISGEAQLTGKNDLLKQIVEMQPTLNFSAKNISKRLKTEYIEKFNVPLNLSDSGSYYNKTDVLYKDEPNGMLLFSGAGVNNVGFILFENKGITSQCNFLYYRTKKRKVIQMESLILKKQPHNFEELRHLIMNKEFL